MNDMRTIVLGPLAGATLLLGGGLALAQTPQTPEPKSPPPAATKPDAPKPDALKMTEQQAKLWIDKPVFSSDGKELGEVAAFKRGADNTVLELHADLGGVLGIGETRVRVTPAQFKLLEDRVVLNMTEAQAKTLPKVNSKK
jgi:hypothetical protein